MYVLYNLREAWNLYREVSEAHPSHRIPCSMYACMHKMVNYRAGFFLSSPPPGHVSWAYEWYLADHFDPPWPPKWPKSLPRQAKVLDGTRVFYFILAGRSAANGLVGVRLSRLPSGTSRGRFPPVMTDSSILEFEFRCSVFEKEKKRL